MLAKAKGTTRTLCSDGRTDGAQNVVGPTSTDGRAPSFLESPSFSRSKHGDIRNGRPSPMVTFPDTNKMHRVPSREENKYAAVYFTSLSVRLVLFFACMYSWLKRRSSSPSPLSSSSIAPQYSLRALQTMVAKDLFS